MDEINNYQNIYKYFNFSDKKAKYTWDEKKKIVRCFYKLFVTSNRSKFPENIKEKAKQNKNKDKNLICKQSMKELSYT